MKKLFAALIATAFVTGAFAQTANTPTGPTAAPTAAPKKATKKAVKHTNKKHTSQKKTVPAA
jgi:hypothetical protein